MRTLRGQLTLAYAAALVVALLVFAIGTLLALDAVQRRLLDAELGSVANAEAAALDFQADGVIDTVDRERFRSVPSRRVQRAVLGRTGELLASSSSAPTAAIVRAGVEAMRPMTATLVDGGATIRATFVPIFARNRRTATVAVWSDTDAIEAVDRTVGVVFALAIPIFAGLAALAGGAIARRGLAPLEQIIADASEIEAHDLSARVRLPATMELNRLAATLNRMLERLSAAFDRERRFAGDASHELRAPLSIILAEADLALAAERDSATYRRALETIAIEADGLEALTRNLLATARAGDNGPVNVEPVDLAEVAATIAERVRILADARRVTIRASVAGEAVVLAHPEGLEQAVLTVVHNAIKYAARGGTIGLDVRVVDETVELRVADDGPGFSRPALDHAFDRFWRDDGSDAATGHGLGLSIAHAIVERYRGTIELANRASGGALVTFRFPKTT